MRRPRSPRARGTSGGTTSAPDQRRELDDAFAAALQALGFDDGPAALAVSGGGDSMALMHLFTGWAKRVQKQAPQVLIVDHGLRPEAGMEARHVSGWARDLRLDAHVLSWTGPKPATGIEEAAREARYRLMGDWCRRRSIRAVFTGHTLDDQAETFLLRLGRGSGVDGLSAMRPRTTYPLQEFGEIELYRPLLGFERGNLRNFLTHQGIDWLEDPMNADSTLARTRVRNILPALQAAGVPPRRIAAAADHLARAREALEAAVSAFLSDHARFGPDGAVLDGAGLTRLPREIGLRALSTVLLRVSGACYRPRFERLASLFDAILSGTLSKARTLLTCRIAKAPSPRQTFGPGTLVVTREAPRRSTNSVIG